jgi:exopolysaccharide biosynthesis polyprenyl glycosylphosphotransferase
VEWEAHFQAFTTIFLLWLLVFFINGVFDIATFRGYFRLFYKILVSMGVNLLVAITYFYIQPNLILTPRRFLLIDVVVASGLILGWHLLIKYFLKNKLTEDLYLFSFNSELAELEQEIQQRDYLGYRLMGHIDEAKLMSMDFVKGASIILPDRLEAKPAVVSQLYNLRKKGMVFYNHQAFYEILTRKIYLSKVNEIWFVENITYKEKRLFGLVKRFLDVCFGFLGLVVFVITFPLLALLVKLSSPGPVLFIQPRVGLNGKVFTVYKYRTMKGGVNNTWTAVSDPRVTPFGRFMRVSRLDELPQCLNLLLGTMSIVGPRPEQVHLVALLRDKISFYDERHMVKPGLTGWAQINNIYAATVEETELKLQYDLYYIKNRSLLFDLEIILKTIYYVFSWQGR